MKVDRKEYDHHASGVVSLRISEVFSVAHDTLAAHEALRVSLLDR